jgi:hypothetical protein
VLNQVLVRFDDSDDVTRAVIDAVVGSGRAYVGPSVFKGRGCMRISVCNGWTSHDDVLQTVELIRSSLAEARVGT